MDIDLITIGRPQHKKLSPEDLKCYWDKYLCFEYGQEGHCRTDCPQKSS